MKSVLIILLLHMNLLAMCQQNDSSSFYFKINELSNQGYSDKTITIIDNSIFYKQTILDYSENGETIRAFEIELNKTSYLKKSILSLLSSQMDTIQFHELLGDHQLPEYEIILKYQSLNLEYRFWGGIGIILQLYFIMKQINKHLPNQDQLKYATFIDELK